MSAGKRIYVAGHRGMVGSAIVRSLQRRGVDAVILTRTHAELDLTQQAQVRAFFAAERPDEVYMAAARVGGLATTIQDGHTGYLVPWRDPALYAERLAALLGDPALRRRLGDNGPCVAARYDWAQVAEEIYGIYCGLVRCERRASGTTATLVGR